MLQLFWTLGGPKTTKLSPNTMNQEEKKALQTFEDEVKDNGERYETGLPWKNYLTELRSLAKHLNEDKQIAPTNHRLIQNDIVKCYIQETD